LQSSVKMSVPAGTLTVGLSWIAAVSVVVRLTLINGARHVLVAGISLRTVTVNPKQKY